ncbi:ABC transporter permease [Rhodococcoides trifolii]|uniref:ABC transporter permease n=1 Tax=Rhodococcoides trifolii TaxID=908250 RepID=A0A917G2F4_9NOCA|nr:ABC transporter ATP-binding protein [Rhodococcus trifolii]GGG19164.1 ABC transporter permease [Rhodococcus trifolii]
MTHPEILPVASGLETWRWLCAELKPHRAQAIVTALVAIVGAAASIIPFYAMSILIDKATENAPTSAIVPLGVAITLAAVVGGVATGWTSYLVSRLGETILADLRERVVATALHIPTERLERIGKGDVLSRVGTDVATVAKAVSSVLPVVISGLLLGALSVVAMAGLDWRLGLAGLVAVPAYVLAGRWYLPRSAPRYAQERRAIGHRSSVLMESMQGVQTVHAYRLEDTHLRQVDISSAAVRDISVNVFALFTRFVGRVNRAEFLGLSVILVTGFFLVRADEVSVGQTAAAALLFARLFNPVGMVLFMFDEVQSANASLARLVGVVSDSPPAPNRAARAVKSTALELSNVEFGYDSGVPVVRGVSIGVEAGQRVALVGATGAGKSTLAAIAAGLLDPDEGSATVGGVPVAELDRGSVAIVSQEVHVFSGPLIEDLRLARSTATQQDVLDALDAVGAREWVDALPEGVDTVVGEGGHSLTASHAQQLALARIVLLDPDIVVLDEATAEAGSLGARDLELSAAAATQGRTTLVVAHRLTQAATADRVVVLDRGVVVEEGTHAELVAAQGRYAQLWTAWEGR